MHADWTWCTHMRVTPCGIASSLEMCCCFLLHSQAGGVNGKQPAKQQPAAAAKNDVQRPVQRKAARPGGAGAAAAAKARAGKGAALTAGNLKAHNNYINANPELKHNFTNYIISPRRYT